MLMKNSLKKDLMSHDGHEMLLHPAVLSAAASEGKWESGFAAPATLSSYANPI